MLAVASGKSVTRCTSLFHSSDVPLYESADRSPHTLHARLPPPSTVWNTSPCLELPGREPVPFSICFRGTSAICLHRSLPLIFHCYWRSIINKLWQNRKLSPLSAKCLGPHSVPFCHKSGLERRALSLFPSSPPLSLFYSPLSITFFFTFLSLSLGLVLTSPPFRVPPPLPVSKWLRYYSLRTEAFMYVCLDTYHSESFLLSVSRTAVKQHSVNWIFLKDLLM